MAKMSLFNYLEEESDSFISTDKASYGGIALKSFILLIVAAVVSAVVAMFLPKIDEAGNFETFIIVALVSFFIGIIAFWIGRMNPNTAKICSFIYCFGEGILLGAINCIVDCFFPGICGIVLISTFIIFGIVLFLYAVGILKVGSKFKTTAIALGIGIVLLSLVCFIGVMVSPELKDSLGILIALEFLFLIYGVICLVFNFAEAQAVVDLGLAKPYEWSVALGITESFIYIYIEALRIAVYILALTKKD